MEECEYWPPISVGQCGRLSFERWVAHRNNSESDSAGLTRGAPGSERTRREWNGDSLWDFSRHISAVKSWTEIYRFIHNSRYPLWPVRAAGRAATNFLRIPAIMQPVPSQLKPCHCSVYTSMGQVVGFPYYRPVDGKETNHTPASFLFDH